MADPLSKAFAIARGWVHDGVVPGVALAAMRHGELAGEFYAGKQAAGAGRPVDASTLYSVASITKPFTAAVFMRLVDRGAVGLDEEVRRIVPAFTGADKQEIILRDLLCHLSGLPKDDPAEAALWQARANFETTAASAAALPLATVPGERFAYSNAGYWVLGAAIAAVTEVPFSTALRTEVLEPAGLTDTFISPPENVWARIARRYGRAKIMNAPYGRELGSPSAGIFATARDLVRFAHLFLNGGQTRDSHRVLSTASVALMTTDQTDGKPGGIEGVQTWPSCPWGLGWEVKGDKLHHWTGDLTSAATFSHFGQGGALLWADPEYGVACAILANRDIATGWTTNPARWARMSNAVLAALT
ncbi:MAG: serine hydrolase domain-containing protein [Thermomicrobiales bacterium]